MINKKYSVQQEYIDIKLNKHKYRNKQVYKYIDQMITMAKDCIAYTIRNHIYVGKS